MTWMIGPSASSSRNAPPEYDVTTARERVRNPSQDSHAFRPVQAAKRSFRDAENTLRARMRRHCSAMSLSRGAYSSSGPLSVATELGDVSNDCRGMGPPIEDCGT